MRLEIAKIQVIRRHLRRTLNEEHVKAIADDMMQPHGQLQPIAVRKHADGYELIAGRNRLAAATLNGWTHIEAHEVEFIGAAEIAGAAENLKRQQMSPLEEADLVRFLTDDQHMTIGEIAERTGHGRSWIQDRLMLSTLPTNFQEAVHDRDLTISAAATLCQITQEDYRDYLLHCAKVNGCTIHQAEAWWLDWQARAAMIAQQDWNGAIPQPPPLPEPPPMRCFLCAEMTPRQDMGTVTVCCECINTVQREKQKALAAQLHTSAGATPEEKQISRSDPLERDHTPQE